MKGWDCQDGRCACRYCGQTKSCRDFTSSASSSRGHTLRCADCTTEINQARYRAAHPDYTPPQTIACYWCGLRFRKKRDRIKYCSMDCQYAARRKAPASRVHYFTCLHCAKLQTARRAGRKYCNKECNWRHLYPSTLVKPRPARCRDCGKTYNQEHGNNLRCAPCAAARSDAIRGAVKARRRSRERSNGPWEAIDRRSIYERDNWRCYLCGQRVSTTAPTSDPLAPTLDHVTPLALGGTHTADNLRLACRACNTAKGASFLVAPSTPSKRQG